MSHLRARAGALDKERSRLFSCEFGLEPEGIEGTDLVVYLLRQIFGMLAIVGSEQRVSRRCGSELLQAGLAHLRMQGGPRAAQSRCKTDKEDLHVRRGKETL